MSCRYSVCHGANFMLGYGYFPTADQAIAAWNTRAVDPAAIREAALREAWKAVNKVFNGFPNHASDAVLALIGEKK